MGPVELADGGRARGGRLERRIEREREAVGSLALLRVPERSKQAVRALQLPVAELV